jgi:hypothetical protein
MIGRVILSALAWGLSGGALVLATTCTMARWTP